MTIDSGAGAKISPPMRSWTRIHGSKCEPSGPPPFHVLLDRDQRIASLQRRPAPERSALAAHQRQPAPRISSSILLARPCDCRSGRTEIASAESTSGPHRPPSKHARKPRPIRREVGIPSVPSSRHGMETRQPARRRQRARAGSRGSLRRAGPQYLFRNIVLEILGEGLLRQHSKRGRTEVRLICVATQPSRRIDRAHRLCGEAFARR